jgi:hypothetical protein
MFKSLGFRRGDGMTKDYGMNKSNHFPNLSARNFFVKVRNFGLLLSFPKQQQQQQQFNFDFSYMYYNV